MAPIDVETVRATPSDSATVYEYYVKHYNFHVPSGPPDDWAITETVLKQNIGARDDPSKFFDAFHAKDRKTGQVLGQIAYYKIFDFYYGKGLEVGQILVDDEYRGNKIGWKLMREVAKIASADGCYMTWYARNWNVKGHKFYESLGAQKLKELISDSGAHHFMFFMFKDAIDKLAKADD